MSQFDSEDSEAILERAENGYRLFEKSRATSSLRFLVVPRCNRPKIGS
jgi:hypothetical protein